MPFAVCISSLYLCCCLISISMFEVSVYSIDESFHFIRDCVNELTLELILRYGYPDYNAATLLRWLSTLAVGSQLSLVGTAGQSITVTALDPFEIPF